MKEQEDKNYVSVGSWMGMMFITAIPLVGLLMILIWSFAGENESRKNYFRAILSWVAIFVVLGVAAFFVIQHFGGTPAVQQFIQDHQNWNRSQ
jgi:Na+/melibiose symporter-like transporter